VKVYNTEISGVLLIELQIFNDNRGFFLERFNMQKFQHAGIEVQFVQDNHSRSIPSVVRGLHMQLAPPQGKLVGVISGAIMDVVVDLRHNSPTFGKHLAIELSDENGLLLWIPGDNLAHGFCVISDKPADVLYKVDQYYNKDTEVALKWNDPELAITWPVANPIVSARDNEAISFTEYKTRFI
jgi:dTDP-4-dehydrorhamnose 3,5-epimerase